MGCAAIKKQTMKHLLMIKHIYWILKIKEIQERLLSKALKRNTWKFEILSKTCSPEHKCRLGEIVESFEMTIQYSIDQYYSTSLPIQLFQFVFCNKQRFYGI